MSKLTFIYQLYNLLLQDYAEIYWCKNGTSFCIKDWDVFKNLLPTHFTSVDSIESFKGQLLLHGFKADNHGFSHPDFRRGKKRLIARIRKVETSENTSMVHTLTNLIKDQREVCFLSIMPQSFDQIARADATLHAMENIFQRLKRTSDSFEKVSANISRRRRIVRQNVFCDEIVDPKIL